MGKIDAAISIDGDDSSRKERTVRRDVCVQALAVLIIIVGALPRNDAAAETTYEFGFRGGLGMGKITGADAEGIVGIEDYDITISGKFDDYRFGFCGGVYMMAHFTEMLGLRLEALYVMKGGKGEVEGTIDDPGYGVVPFSADVTFKLNYIEMPLLAVLTVPLGEAAKFNVMAGPAFAFNTSSKLKMEIGILGYFLDQTEDIGEEVTGTDIGLVFGGGFEFDAGRVSLFVDGRWTLGISSIDDTGEDLDVKNSTLSFMGGVAIPIGATE